MHITENVIRSLNLNKHLVNVVRLFEQKELLYIWEEIMINPHIAGV